MDDVWMMHDNIAIATQITFKILHIKIQSGYQYECYGGENYALPLLPPTLPTQYPPHRPRLTWNSTKTWKTKPVTLTTVVDLFIQEQLIIGFMGFGQQTKIIILV